jgi:hypothetical protein
MPVRRRVREMPFAEACSLIESALTGSFRHTLSTETANAPTMGRALHRLGDAMRANVFRTSSSAVRLDRVVGPYDRRTRADGFHALNDWDGVSDHVNERTIPVDVLDYLIRERGSQPADPDVVGILVDYYFVYLLALLSLRIWDAGDADENLDRLGRLLNALQGSDGSRQQFVANAETLILLATSHYELEERGFAHLLEQVRTLGERHRVDIALGHAVCLGCHLRFGFEASYGKDVGAMRNDNVADYPWLCFSLATLMDAYEQDAAGSGADRRTLAEAILNGLSPDAAAFTGPKPPGSLTVCAAERARFVEQCNDHRHELLERFERFRPSDDRYSPLSLFFNFSQNVLKGLVVDALLWGEPSAVTLNDLLTEHSPGPAGAAKAAATLMGYARSNPDRIAGRMTPAIVYDPVSGRRAFAAALRAMKG